jgi:dGTPase
LFGRHYAEVVGLYPNLGERRLVHEVIRRMINYVVVDLIQATQLRLAEARPSSIEEVRSQPNSLVALSENCRTEHGELMAYLREHVYRHYKVLRMNSKARRVLKELFEAFFSDVHLMPPEHRDAALHAENKHGPSGRARCVADYIAGMTDRYAIQVFERFYVPGPWAVLS